MSETDAEFDLPLEDMLEIVASGGNGSEYVNWSQMMEDAAKKLRTQANEIARLRAALRNMEQHMEENITLTEALRNEQEWVIRLSGALRGVIRVADRNTAEFDAARAALGEKV